MPRLVRHGLPPRICRGRTNAALVVRDVDATAQAGDVGAVDVQRDGPATADASDPVDVVAGRQYGYGAGCVDPAVGRAQHRGAAFEPLLVLDAFEHTGGAPRNVVVDGRFLAGQPDQRDDREPAARVDM